MMSRQKYFMVVLPVSALVLGYLGYWLHEQHGVDYGPTGVGIAVIAILGLLLPPGSGQCEDGERRPRPGR